MAVSVATSVTRAIGGQWLSFLDHRMEELDRDVLRVAGRPSVAPAPAGDPRLEPFRPGRERSARALRVLLDEAQLDLGALAGLLRNGVLHRPFSGIEIAAIL